MNPRTLATRQELEAAEWFAAVGTPAESSVVLLSSWSDAIAACTSEEWGDVQLEMANRLRESVLKISLDRFNVWNEIVAEVKQVTQPMVRRKVAAVASRHDLPSSFEQDVQWDILHVCMEAEYADLVPPSYYAGLAYWYLHGHFPCGWRSVPPPGRLVLY